MPTWLKPEDEVWWAEAKSVAEKEGHKNDYGYIVGIFKRIKKGSQKQDYKNSKETALNNEIEELAEKFILEKELKQRTELVDEVVSLLKQFKTSDKISFKNYMNPKYSDLFFLANSKLLDKINSEQCVKEKILLEVYPEALEKYLEEFSDTEEINLKNYNLCLVMKQNLIDNSNLFFKKIKQSIPETISRDANSVAELAKKEGKNSFIIDKKYSSPKLFVHKLKDDIKIFNMFGQDFTSFFDKEIFYDVQKEQRDLILECNVTYMNGKLESKQESIKEDVLDAGCVDSSTLTQVILNVTDVLYLDKDVTSCNLEDRKKLLKTINYSHHLKQSPFVYSENIEQIPKGIILMSKLLWANGSILRDSKKEYTQGKNNDEYLFQRDL